MGDEEINELLHALRAKVGRADPAARELIERLDRAARQVLQERDQLRSRLERPLTPRPHAVPGRVEELARKLDSLGTAGQ